MNEQGLASKYYSPMTHSGGHMTDVPILMYMAEILLKLFRFTYRTLFLCTENLYYQMAS